MKIVFKCFFLILEIKCLRNNLVEKTLPQKTKLERKTCIFACRHQQKQTQKVEEIRGQFHQPSTSSFFAYRSRKCKKRLPTSLSFCVLSRSVRAKAAHRMWMKLTQAERVR